MAETERKTTFCTQCGQEVGAAKFCPNCGAALPNETPAEEPIEPIKEQAKKKTLWERFAPKNPVLSIILSIALVAVPAVAIVAVPNIIDHFEEVKQEREQKAAEQAFMDERQALWAEYATRWNSYADQRATAPTKGTEYPFQMAEGYQDAVAFGSGEVSIDMEANYFSPDTIGTVTYKSSAGYPETDVFTLCYIFAGEEQADKLIQQFREDMPTLIPDGINAIQIVLANTEDGTFNPSLEFDYRYSKLVGADSGPFGLRSRVTLDEFIENYNSYIHDDNVNNALQDSGEVTSAVEFMDKLRGYRAGYFKYETTTDPFGYSVYSYTHSDFSPMPYLVFLYFSGEYIVQARVVFDPLTFDNSGENQRKQALITAWRVLGSATGLSMDEVTEGITAEQNAGSPAYQNGFVFGTTKNDDMAYIGVLTITETAWEKYQAGTLTASDGSANQPSSASSLNSDSLARSYLEGWSWEANNGDGTSATLWEILDYELLGPSFTATENKTDGTVIVEDEASGLAIVFSANGGEPTIPPRSSVSEEEFVALCEDYMNVLRGVQTQ